MSLKKPWPNRVHGRSGPFALVVAVALVAFGSGISWGLPEALNPETVEPWALDTIAPIAPLNEAYNRFTREGTENPIYPLFHFVVLAGSYTPYIGLQVVTGDLSDPSAEYPYGVSDIRQFSRHLTLIARFVSLMMGLGIVYAVYRITEELAGRKPAAWAALSCALIAPLAYYSKTSNLDVPYSFWVLLAVWRFVRILSDQKTGDYALLGVFSALAVATKDQAYGFFLLTPFVLAAFRCRSTGQPRSTTARYLRELLSPPMLLAGLATALTYGAANNVFFGGLDGLIRHLTWGGQIYDYRQVSGGVTHTLSAQARLLGDTAILLLQMLGPISLLLAAGGAYLARRARKWHLLALLAFPISYYLSVIAVFELVFSRYLLVVAALLTPFVGLMLHHLLDRAPRTLAWLAIAGALLPQAALVTNLNLTLMTDSRVAMAEWIRDNVAPGALIEAQVRQRMLPRIPEDRRLLIAGNTGDAITMATDEQALTPAALAERSPDYILVLEGLGVTGDPEGWTSPALRSYYEQLTTGELGYRMVAKFETVHFLPFRQIPGTRPRSTMYARTPMGPEGE